MAKNLARDAKRYAEQNGIPIVCLEHVQRKDDIAVRIQRRHPAKDGVVFIRIAQEDPYAFKGHKIITFYRRLTVSVRYVIKTKNRRLGSALILYD